jgi:hypothetical protein
MQMWKTNIASHLSTARESEKWRDIRAHTLPDLFGIGSSTACLCLRATLSSPLIRLTARGASVVTDELRVRRLYYHGLAQGRVPIYLQRGQQLF